MSVLAAAGFVLLALGGAPGCSAQQAPSLDLPASSFPDIVATASDKPADALAALEARRSASGSIEADVLRARLLGEVGRHAESADAWNAVAAAEPALAAFAKRAAFAAHAAAGNEAGSRAVLDELMSGATPADHTDLALILATRHRTAGRHDDARALYRAVLT
ncbi:MAG: hypothetical protein M3Q55_00050, partial [Acidobacteriota bacterium]|nr:hypothetical protein [Acidobacteriota bacterium]